jgi:hypothetical protein
MGVHCMAHTTNLAIQTLSHLQIVNKIEGLLQTLYNYLSKSFKKNLKLPKLAKLMKTQGGKILKNLKTHWTSMLFLIWHAMVENKILLMKKAIDGLTIEKAMANFELLCHVMCKFYWGLLSFSCCCTQSTT